MLEYLDTIDSDSDFIPESDTDDTSQEEVSGRHGSKPQIKPKIITSYNKFMGSFDSSEMMLYSYLDERQTMPYWKKVAFNSIAMMVSNSYILYMENCRGSGKLKSRYNYNVFTTERLGKEWLALKETAGADYSQGPQELRKLPEKKVSKHCLQHKGEEAESHNSMHQMQQGAACWALHA
jgi:hypothetical protein